MNKADRIRELELRKQRGEEAEKVLSNPLVEHVLTLMEKELVNTMKALDSSDEIGRDTTWRDLQAVDKFEKKFKDYIRNGQQARTLMDKLLGKK